MTIDTVDTEVFPTYLLEECDSALVLFCAAFGGIQDALFIRDAKLTNVVCVDNDPVALSRMMPSYPKEWLFWEQDAFAYMAKWALLVEYDIVTLDPFTGDTMNRVLDKYLGVACKLATKYVVCGCDNRNVKPPRGWRIKSRMLRSRNSVYWLILESKR